MTTRTQLQTNDRERKKGGRPRLPDGEKRDCPVKVYFDRRITPNWYAAASGRDGRSPRLSMNWR